MNTTKLNLLDFNFGGEGVTAFRQLSRTLDGIIHPKARTFSVNNPTSLSPGPNPGETFIIGTSGAGAWSGQTRNIAIAKETVVPTDSTTFDSASDWTFITRSEGMIVWVMDQPVRKTYVASWVSPSSVPLTEGASESLTIDRLINVLDTLRDQGVIAT